MKRLLWFLFLVVACGAQDADKLTVANNHFGLRLLNQLPAPKEKNVFFSPYSVFTAMGMAYAGARSSTQQDLYTGLGYETAGLPDNKVLEAYAAHTQRLLSPSNATLKVANGAAVHDKLNVLPAYQNALTNDFQAEVHKVDFEKNGQAAIDVINRWTNEKTQGKIAKVFDQPLDPLTRLVLLNAIYFKGTWQTQFNESNTSKKPFYNGGVNEVQVDTMSGEFLAQHGVYSDMDVEVVDLPYRGLDFSMTVLLPTQRDGVEALKRNLTVETLQHLIGRLAERRVDVQLPKFKLETSYELKEPLQALGIRRIFGTDADLSGINGGTDLRVSRVVHKAVVEVNEEGAEAAAVSAVVAVTRVGSYAFRFWVDHPFIFLIRNTRTNDILFAGQVNHLGTP